MTGPPAHAGASSPTLDEVLLPVTEPITIEESARLIGAWEWAEGRFYQVIGGWVTSASRPGTQNLLRFVQPASRLAGSAVGGTAARRARPPCTEVRRERARYRWSRRPDGRRRALEHLLPGRTAPRCCRLPLLAETVLSHRETSPWRVPSVLPWRMHWGIGSGVVACSRAISAARAEGTPQWRPPEPQPK